MAGGTFDLNVPKVRPGVYANLTSKKNPGVNGANRGTVIVPLSGYGWGPDKAMLTISAEAPDAHVAELGYSVYDDNNTMLLIREAMKRCLTCIVYIINPGTKATANAISNKLVMTAKYGGTRGNALAVACVAETGGTFGIKVYLGTDLVEEYTGLSTIKSLIDASEGKYVVFTSASSNDSLAAFASASLTGGADGTVSNQMVTDFLDASENANWDTMCFPFTESALQTAAKTKSRYFIEQAGKNVQIVMPDCSGDYEGVINVTNAVVVDGKNLTHAQACAWVAGATAAATRTQSLTYLEYDGATDVVDRKTNAQAIAAINNGEFFFSISEAGAVIVEYDINSLHTFTAERTADYSKNRIIRVYFSFLNDLRLTFPPNRFNNNEEGWLMMEGLGRSLLASYQKEGAIENVDPDADFSVDRSRSQGDSTYFNFALQAVDSSEKLYFSGTTR